MLYHEAGHFELISPHYSTVSQLWHILGNQSQYCDFR